ncbi:unknown [Clostridium sp. CAG:921]|nr:unknown [Clostridium sp. CAG:921]
MLDFVVVVEFALVALVAFDYYLSAQTHYF